MGKRTVQQKKERKLRTRLLRRYFFDKMVVSIYRYFRNKFISLCRIIKGSPIIIWGALTLIVVSVGTAFVLRISKEADGAASIIGEMVCAIVSGAITVFGIAWTLHAQQKAQKEEDRLAVRPYITYGSEENDVIVPIKIYFGSNIDNSETPLQKREVNSVTPEQIGKNRYLCSYGSFCLHVADYAECCLESILIDDERQYLEPFILLRKGTTYYLDFSNYYFKMNRRNNPHIVEICIADMRSNLYYYQLETSIGSVKRPDFKIYNENRKRIDLIFFEVTGIAQHSDDYDKIVLKKENDQSPTPLTGYWSNLKGFIFNRNELADKLLANYRWLNKKR